MRGKGVSGRKPCYCIRITPAYAGKSTWKYMPFVTLQDHPRLCGEKMLDSHFSLTLSGSPPPMRGKARRRGDLRVVTRITPAYAGKSVPTLPSPDW